MKNVLGKRPPMSPSVLRLIKVASFVVLLAFVVTTMRWGFSTKDKVVAQSKQPVETILQLPIDRITQIRILHEKKEVTFNKQAKIWGIRGQDYDLDQEHIAQLVDQVSRLEAKKLIDAQEDLGKYGLAIPIKTVEIILSNKKKALLLIGDKVPIGNSYYVQIHGKPDVYLLNAKIANLFSENISNYGNLLFPEIDWENLKKIEIERDYSVIRIHEHHKKTADLFTRYRFTKPFEYSKLNVSSEALAKLWQLWVESPLQKEGLVMGVKDWSEYGLKSPKIHVLLEDQEGGLFDLSIGQVDRNGDYYARFANQNEVFVLPKTYVQPLIDVTPFSLLNRFVALLPITEISSFSLVGQDKKFWGEVTQLPSDAKKAKKKSRRKSKKNQAQDKEEPQKYEYMFNGNTVTEKRFKGIYEALVSLRYEREKEPTLKIGRPIWELTYYDKKGKTLRHIAFLSYTATQYAIQVNGRPMPVTIGRAQLGKVMVEMGALVDDVRD